MIYFYKITDLKSGKVYHQRSDVDEFASYRDFIGNLETMNDFWCGLLKYEEDIIPLPEKEKKCLTSEFEMV